VLGLGERRRDHGRLRRESNPRNVPLTVRFPDPAKDVRKVPLNVPVVTTLWQVPLVVVVVCR
jgi:hypothetical protein